MPMLQPLRIGIDHTGDTHSLLAATGDETRTRRTANGTRRVKIRETQPGTRNRINVRRLAKGAAIVTEVPITEVVGHDHDEVRTIIEATVFLRANGDFQ